MPATDACRAVGGRPMKPLLIEHLESAGLLRAGLKGPDAYY
jgi:hypothetical protein